MGSRSFNVVVVLFWLAMTSWLLVAKVAPQLRRGEPPDYLSVQRKQLDEPAVGWNIIWTNRQKKTDDKLGWAISKLFSRPDGAAELRSRIQFTLLSSDQLLLRSLWSIASLPPLEPGDLAVRMDSRIPWDANGRLQGFTSRVFVGQSEFNIDGHVQGNKLSISLRTAYGNTPVLSIGLGEAATVDDGIAPRGFMPPLKLHQTWRIQQYGPLSSSQTALGLSEVVQATVQRQETILWDGDRENHQENCWLIVYRRDAGSGSKSADAPLGQLWVRVADGMVLKQQVSVLGERLTFVRLSATKARDLAGPLDRNWLDLAGDDPAAPQFDAATAHRPARPRVFP